MLGALSERVEQLHRRLRPQRLVIEGVVAVVVCEVADGVDLLREVRLELVLQGLVGERGAVLDARLLLLALLRSRVADKEVETPADFAFCSNG